MMSRFLVRCVLFCTAILLMAANVTTVSAEVKRANRLPHTLQPQIHIPPHTPAPTCVDRSVPKPGDMLRIPEFVCTYKAPKYNYIRLDWCRVWGKECGAPAAQAFCKSYGHGGLDTKQPGAYSRADNVGPTVIISTRQKCNDKSCDGFGYIRCTGLPANAKQGFFRYPTLPQGERLDWCRLWAKECGRPAADAFCRSKHYDAAGKWARANDVGPTRIIGSGQVCKDKTCDGFEYVSCVVIPR